MSATDLPAYASLNTSAGFQDGGTYCRIIVDYISSQLRWSVGWAHNGRRAAKYFPVKLFGMREGYDMAVSFKSTKTVPLEPSTPLLTNSIQAADGPASTAMRSENGSTRSIMAGGPATRVEKSLVSFTADAPVALSLQPQPEIAGATSLCSRTWQEKFRLFSPCYSEIPLAASCLMLTPDSQASSDGKIAEISATTTTRTGVQIPSGRPERVIPPSQPISCTAGSDKEENTGRMPDAHASAPSSPGRTADTTVHSLPCLRPPHSQWPFTSVSEIDQLKLSAHFTATGGKMGPQSVVEGRFLTSDVCCMDSTQESMPQVAGVLMTAPPFAPQHPHDSGQTRDGEKPLCCRNPLELCGVNNSTEASVSVVSAASTVGNPESTAATSDCSPQTSSSAAYGQVRGAYNSAARFPLAPHPNQVGSRTTAW